MKEKKLCTYGCGKEAKYYFKSVDKWCCSKSHNSCPEMKKKQVEGHKGFKHTEETKEILRQKSTGHPGYWKDKKLSINVRKKISISNTGNHHSEKTKKKLSIAFKGKNNPMFGKYWSKEMLIKRKLSISQIKKRYPLFAKIEEMRYNPDKPDEKEIQVHCKNHNCSNSKEQGGWFTLIGTQLDGRRGSIEDGINASYFYCSEKCKEECPLYNKTVNQLIKEDQINSGQIEDSWYTSQEYQIWRNKVFELDNNKCVYCEQLATIAHHILPQKIYPNLSLDPENGLSVCLDCHYKYGHKGECSTGNLSKLICERIIRIKRKEK